MANQPPLIIDAGTRQQLPSGDTLTVGAGIDTPVPQTLEVGATAATLVALAKSSVITRAMGNLEVQQNTTLGNNEFVDLTTFNSRINSNFVPDANNTRDLGELARAWRFVYANTLQVLGNSTLGDNAATDLTTFNSRIASNVVPSADNTRDLGDASRAWRVLYANATSLSGTRSLFWFINDTPDGAVDQDPMLGLLGGDGLGNTWDATFSFDSSQQRLSLSMHDGLGVDQPADLTIGAPIQNFPTPGINAILRFAGSNAASVVRQAVFTYQAEDQLVTGNGDTKGFRIGTEVGLKLGGLALFALDTSTSSQARSVYVNGTNSATGAIATALATSKVLGVVDADGDVIFSGPTLALFEPGLVPAPAPGDNVYLSVVTAGEHTNVAPVVVGQCVTYVGTVLDATTYGVNQLCTIFVRPARPVEL